MVLPLGFSVVEETLPLLVEFTLLSAVLWVTGWD